MFFTRMELYGFGGSQLFPGLAISPTTPTRLLISPTVSPMMPGFCGAWGSGGGFSNENQDFICIVL